MPMKDFLNRYMASNRDLTKQGNQELSTLFRETVSTIAAGIGPQAFRPVRAVNAAVVDSVMTGVARRLADGAIKHGGQLATQYEKLLKNKKYWDAVETGTSQDANVAERLKLATEYFATVK